MAAELGSPWLVLAFWAGRRSGKVRLSGLWGASTIVLGFIAYYGWLLAVEDRLRHSRGPGVAREGIARLAK